MLEGICLQICSQLTYLMLLFASLPTGTINVDFKLVIWQVTNRSPPSLSCPLFPSLPSVPPFSLSLVNLLPDPPFPPPPRFTMLIKEYRIPMPMSVEEYRIAQLYMIQVRSPRTTSTAKWCRSQGTRKCAAGEEIHQHGRLFKCTITVCPIMKWLVTRCVTPVERLNKESLCADRLSSLNSLKLAVSTRHRLHVFIQEEGGGTLLSSQTQCDGDGRTAFSVSDSFICLTRPWAGDWGSA